MFIGHYGPAFAAKPAHRALPLWVLFVAVQWVDFGWSALVLLGVEKARVVPGFTEASPLDLYFMPYTHGLPGAVVLSVAFGALVMPFLPKGARRRAFLVASAAALSHWFCDLLVHVPDLPLWGDGGAKVGLGLWRHAAISVPLEIASLVAGAVVYARALGLRGRGRAALAGFVAALGAVELVTVLGPGPTSARGEAVAALVAYVVLAAAAAAVERAQGAAFAKATTTFA